MEVLTKKWILEFETVYCDPNGEHYSGHIRTSAVKPRTKEAITECWHTAVDSANEHRPAKDAVLISLELIDTRIESVKY